MTDRPVIAVVGATGGQGGGVIEACAGDPQARFQARALTRDADSEAARRVARTGAQVVAADLDDPESIAAAFDGATAAFVVTNYWAPLADGDDRSPAERELAQAHVAASAAKTAGLAHVVWSTLEDTRTFFGPDGPVPTVDGGYTVPHFDAKAEADQFFRDNAVPTTFLRTTLFYEGFADALGPIRTDDGRLILTLPIADQPMPAIAVGDIGKVAYAILAEGERHIDHTISIAGDSLTGVEYAAALGRTLGETVTYSPQGFDEFRAQDFPGAVEMGNMFQFYAQNAAAFDGARDLAVVRRLNPQLTSFSEWLTNHAQEVKKA